MTGWALEALAGSALLMLAVLILRGPVRRAFGPQFAYALWILPLLRLIMPPLPAGWQIGSWVGKLWPASGGGTDPAAVKGLPDGLLEHALSGVSVSAAAPSASVSSGLDWQALLLAALVMWIIGAVTFLIWQLVRYRRFCGKLQRTSDALSSVAAGRVHVIRARGAAGPMAFGIWRKYVAFPADFEARYDAQERELALAHELGHHARGDLIANWAALIVLSLHWFNPIAWRAFRAFRADQEMACDALVLAGRSEALRHAYGRAIVKSAHGGAVSAACHLHSINELKGRLKMLTKHKKTPMGRKVAGVAGVAATIVAGLALTASGVAADTLNKDAQTIDGALKVKPVAQMVTTPRAVAAPAGDDVAAPGELPPVPAVPPAPKATRTVPAVPAAPVAPTQTADVPPPPPAPDPVVAPDGKKTVRKMMFISKDGKVTKLNADGPAVISGDCGKGSGDVDNIVWTDKDGKTRKQVKICVDRIETKAKAAAMKAVKVSVDAEAISKTAMKSALDSLRTVRNSFMTSDMDPAQRKEAIAGIDQAIAEMEREIASGGNKD